MLKIWAFLKEEHEMVDPELDPVFTQKVRAARFNYRGFCPRILIS